MLKCYFDLFPIFTTCVYALLKDELNQNLCGAVSNDVVNNTDARCTFAAAWHKCSILK